MISQFGLTDRFRLLAGGMHEVDFGKEHQLALLGHILHSEGEARSRAVHAKTNEALAPDGVIAIAESLVNPDRAGPQHSLFFAVNMLVHTQLGDSISYDRYGFGLRKLVLNMFDCLKFLLNLHSSWHKTVSLTPHIYRASTFSKWCSRNQGDFLLTKPLVYHYTVSTVQVRYRSERKEREHFE